MRKPTTPSKAQIEKTKAIYECHGECDEQVDPRVQKLVEDLLGHIADKWTMIILELLVEHKQLRFTQLSKMIDGISQKMLTQTLRYMERDGLLTRTVHPVVPPRVDYRITEMGTSLSYAFCGVWVWAADNLLKVEEARRKFQSKANKSS
jgi:DNA-binding HxlR family transcriptional regulator